MQRGGSFGMVRRDSRLKRDQRGNSGPPFRRPPDSTTKAGQKGPLHDQHTLGDHRLRGVGNPLCDFYVQSRAQCRPGQRPNAGNRCCGAGRRPGLPQSAIPHDRRRRSCNLHSRLVASRSATGRRLLDRRVPVWPRRLHRHERVGACQRAHGSGRNGVAGQGSRHRFQGRCDYRHAGGGLGASRRLRLLRHPHRVPRLGARQPRCR